MAPRFTQGEIDNKVMRMMTRAFVLANYHLSGYDQQYAGELYDAMTSAYRYGPMGNRQIMACLIRTSSDTFRATATAIDMLLCAVLRAPAGEPPFLVANATTPPTMPAVECFLVMLDDARMQATYEHITGLTAPNFSFSVPTPFYTTPLVAGGRYLLMTGPNASYNYDRDGDSSFSCFDQHQRLARTQFWCRWANSAASFPYDWAATMKEDNWTDAGTMAVLNRVWGYWIARLGYPGAREYLGEWAREERAYVAGLLEKDEEMHDLDVVDALNGYLAGMPFTPRGRREVRFRPRGVFGLRRLIQEEGVAPWRMAQWEDEWKAERFPPAPSTPSHGHPAQI